MQEGTFFPSTSLLSQSASTCRQRASWISNQDVIKDGCYTLTTLHVASLGHEVYDSKKPHLTLVNRLQRVWGKALSFRSDLTSCLITSQAHPHYSEPLSTNRPVSPPRRASCSRKPNQMDSKPRGPNCKVVAVSNARANDTAPWAAKCDRNSRTDTNFGLVSTL